MNQKNLHNLSWIPVFLIGLIAVIMGLLWLIIDEPWLIDRAANEATLGMTFSELFSAQVNQNLPDYLTTVYRFSGLYVLGSGLFTCAYVLVTFMGTPKARNSLLAVLGLFLIILFYLAQTRIPISPFIYLIYGFILLYIVSFWASVQLNRSEPS
ncbi:MAG: hypothetical protein IIA61_12355 [Candidatus Marinimicrobia bacterium]|nr:hypothetical protein [Candidatus Neomarinimicrobiota bacterium]